MTSAATYAELAELARAAGRAGRSWMNWTADDAVQDFVCMHEGDLNTEAWQTAHEEGLRAYLIEAGWVARWTTAPADYDSFGTITIEHHDAAHGWRGCALRRVLIHPHHVRYHEARYGSGLHGSWSEDPRIEEREAGERAERSRLERERFEATRTEGLAWLNMASDREIEDAIDCDEIETRGLTSRDARDEQKRRATNRAELARAAEWERCRAAFADGAILVDDGAPGALRKFGRIPGRDPHVYYGVRVTNDWEKIADNATVVDDAGDQVGALGLVAEWLASGQLRVAASADVPPAPVTRRIGQSQWREIRRFQLGLEVVWVGRPPMTSTPLVLDERGHLVRRAAVRDGAIKAYWTSEAGDTRSSSAEQSSASSDRER